MQDWFDRITFEEEVIEDLFNRGKMEKGCKFGNQDPLLRYILVTLFNRPLEVLDRVACANMGAVDIEEVVSECLSSCS